MMRVKFGREGHGFVTIYNEKVAEKLIKKGVVTKAEDQVGVNEPKELEDMTQFELLAAAREAGVTNVQKYSKAEDLIKAIRKEYGATKPRADTKKSEAAEK